MMPIRPRRLWLASCMFSFAFILVCWYGVRDTKPGLKPQPAELGSPPASTTHRGTFLIQTPSSVSQTSSAKHGFHLVIPASEKDPRLCKTLLSALILDYPPPTLVNFNRTFHEGSPYRDTHLSKIRGILDFLSDARTVKPDDLVLVVDGYDVWFQLPPELLFKRYHQLVSAANERLKREYTKSWWQALGGHAASPPPSPPISAGKSNNSPRPRASVIFGADKLCWPNPSTDPACSCVPNSTLPSDAWGPETDGHPGGWLNRPRYLNSGVFIGPARDLKALYRHAAFKVERGGRAAAVASDQFVLGEIFGEQECQRKAGSKDELHKGLRQWLVDKWAAAATRRSGNAAGSRRPVAGDDAALPSSSLPRRPCCEFGITLDYEMALFQTMTHSGGDVDFLRLNDSAAVMARLHTSARKLDTADAAARTAMTTAGSDPSSPFLSSFLADMASLPSPYHGQPRAGVPISAFFNTSLPSDDEKAAHDGNDGNIGGGGGNGGGGGGGGNGWARVPLAVDTHAPSVPALLHLNGDKALLDAWWPRMWWHAHGRALLRLRVGGQHTAAAAKRPWADDFRGGAGGVWTAGHSDGSSRWLSWRDVCAGYEDAVFGDGRGERGREDASGAVVAADGKLRTEWGEVKADVNLGVW